MADFKADLTAEQLAAMPAKDMARALKRLSTNQAGTFLVDWQARRECRQ